MTEVILGKAEREGKFEGKLRVKGNWEGDEGEGKVRIKKEQRVCGEDKRV